MGVFLVLSEVGGFRRSHYSYLSSYISAIGRLLPDLFLGYALCFTCCFHEFSHQLSLTHFICLLG